MGNRSRNRVMMVVVMKKMTMAAIIIVKKLNHCGWHHDLVIRYSLPLNLV